MVTTSPTKFMAIGTEAALSTHVWADTKSGCCDFRTSFPPMPDYPLRSNRRRPRRSVKTPVGGSVSDPPCCRVDTLPQARRSSLPRIPSLTTRSPAGGFLFWLALDSPRRCDKLAFHPSVHRGEYALFI